jgi:hypothetical protein
MVVSLMAVTAPQFHHPGSIVVVAFCFVFLFFSELVSIIHYINQEEVRVGREEEMRRKMIYGWAADL